MPCPLFLLLLASSPSGHFVSAGIGESSGFCSFRDALPESATRHDDRMREGKPAEGQSSVDQKLKLLQIFRASDRDENLAVTSHRRKQPPQRLLVWPDVLLSLLSPPTPLPPPLIFSSSSSSPPLIGPLVSQLSKTVVFNLSHPSFKIPWHAANQKYRKITLTVTIQSLL